MGRAAPERFSDLKSEAGETKVCENNQHVPQVTRDEQQQFDQQGTRPIYDRKRKIFLDPAQHWYWLFEPFREVREAALSIKGRIEQVITDRWQWTVKGPATERLAATERRNI